MTFKRIIGLSLLASILQPYEELAGEVEDKANKDEAIDPADQDRADSAGILLIRFKKSDPIVTAFDAGNDGFGDRLLAVASRAWNGDLTAEGTITSVFSCKSAESLATVVANSTLLSPPKAIKAGEKELPEWYVEVSDLLADDFALCFRARLPEIILALDPKSISGAVPVKAQELARAVQAADDAGREAAITELIRYYAFHFGSHTRLPLSRKHGFAIPAIDNSGKVKLAGKDGTASIRDIGLGLRIDVLRSPVVAKAKEEPAAAEGAKPAAQVEGPTE